MLRTGKAGAILLAVIMALFCPRLFAQRVSQFDRMQIEGVPQGWTFGGNATDSYRTWTDTAQGLPMGSRCSIIEFWPRSHVNPQIGQDSRFATVMQAISAQDYRDKRVRFSAQLSTAGVTGHAGLWMRVDGANGKVLNFDDMALRPISGTTLWNRYDVVLDIPPASAVIQFGYLLAGRGEMRAAQFRFEVVDASTPTTSNGVPAVNEALPKTPSNLGLDM